MSLAKHGANPRELASVEGPLWGSNQGKGGVQECVAPVGTAGWTSGSNWAFSQGTEMGLPLYPGQGCPDPTHPFWLPSSLRRAEQIPAAVEEHSTQLQQVWDKNEDCPGKQSAKNWCQLFPLTLQTRKGSSASEKYELTGFLYSGLPIPAVVITWCGN